MKDQLAGTSHRWDLDTCINCGIQRKNKSRVLNGSRESFKTKTVMVYFTETATYLHAPPCPVK